MGDKDMIRKAFECVKAPEDTLQRVYGKTENRRGFRAKKHAAIALAAVLILAIGSIGVYAAKQFRISNQFLELSGGDVQNVEQQDGSGGFVISCPFEYENPYVEDSGKHTGVDFPAEEGTPVLAAASGKVRTVEFEPFYGNYVIIDHEDGYSTLYAHLKTTDAAAGDEVEAGTQIGTVGRTGMATGFFLHLELRLDDEPVDPTEYFE